MEAVVDVKYRPVLFLNGGAAAAKRMRQGQGGESVYRECLKNHAASLGGHAVDGCGEFMPAAAAEPSDPASLKCAACGCHRNFHRRLLEAPPSPPLLALPPPPPPSLPAAAAPVHQLHGGGHPQRGEETPDDRLPGVGEDDSEESDEGSEYEDDRPRSPMPAPPLPPPGYVSSATHMLLSLSTGGPGAAPPPGAGAPRPPAPLPGAPPSASVSASAARKRFRTKFSPEQKQRMQALSERLGWRLQKRDEAVVDECCREIGVGKGVFKVWMHNNKHNFLGGHSARRSASASATLHHAPAQPTHPLPLASAAATAPPAHADFNINGSISDAADHPLLPPATASGGSGSPQSP